MNGKTFVLLGLLLTVSVAQAADQGKREGFWNSLTAKVQKLTPTRKSTATTAVGGVRGTKNEEVDIYWKGKDQQVEIGEDELEKFSLAVDSRNKGDNDLARKHFDDFLRDFPRSSLRADAQMAVELLDAKKQMSTPPRP